MKRLLAKKRARVLIIDDHPAVREALALGINKQSDLQVCGEADDTKTALNLITDLKPDIAVIDITLKSESGIELIKRIKTRNDTVRILVWSMHSESLYAERALRAGALGYINKDQATHVIIDAIRRVLDGKVYLSDTLAEKMLHRSVGHGNHDASQSQLAILADRELEVFRLIGHGEKTIDIAAKLHLSVKTIETYRDRIRKKLDLSNGSVLTHVAIQWMLENV